MLYGLVVVGGIVVALAPPALSAAAIAGVAVLLVLLSQPFGALCTLAFSVPFESVRNLQLGGLNVTTTNVIVFTIAAALVGRSAISGEINLNAAPWRTALLIYGVVLLASVSQATYLVGSIKELLKWGQLTLVYLTGATLVKSRRQALILLAVVFLAVLSEAAVGVAQTFLHSGPSSFARGAILRSSGTFDQPNPFAGYLNMTFPLAVACLIFRVLPRKLVWLVTLVTAAGVFSSLSRGAELGSIAALVVLFGVTSQRVRALLPVAGLVIACVFLLGFIGIIPGAVSDPIASGLGVSNVDVANPTPVTWSSAERLAHMEAGLRMFAANPILGVGIGNYPAAYWHYRVEGPWDNPLGHAHNYYINIAAEAGVPGFLAWIFLLGSGIAICVRTYRRAPDDFGRAVSLGGLGVLVAFATHMFFDDLLVHGIEAQLGLVMVLVTVGGFDAVEPAAESPSLSMRWAPDSAPAPVGTIEGSRIMGSVRTDIARQVRERDIRLVRFLFCDLSSIIRAKAVHVHGLEERRQSGVSMGKVALARTLLDTITPVPGLGQVGEVRLAPDQETFVELPYVARAASMCADIVTPDFEPWLFCPRSFLKRTLGRLNARGLRIQAAFESTFTLLRREGNTLEPVDRAGCFATASMNSAAPVINELIDALDTQRLAVEQYSAEAGHGQHQLTIRHADGVGAADNLVIFRETVRGVAAANGLIASFAPKPFVDQPGNACHVHFSLTGSDGRASRFFEPEAPYQMSDTARGFLAGVVEHLPGLTGLACPSVNSYRRMQSDLAGTLAPSWGPDSRLAAVRVVSPYSGEESVTLHAELRIADHAANPYLLLGGIVASGLDGMARECTLPPPLLDDALTGEAFDVPEGLAPLPRNLGDALEALAGDTMLEAALGPELHAALHAIKSLECRQFAEHDVAFELNEHTSRL